MKSKRFLSEVGLYHNLDTLFRLIGKPNESEVFNDDQKVTGLIDLGSNFLQLQLVWQKILN